MTTGLPSWDPGWKRRYNSPPDDLVADFYVPAFARSNRYDRAVGFFSSHLLGAIAPSIDEFVLGGGTMRLITSPANLSDDDLAAMGKGEDLRISICDGLKSATQQPIPSGILLDRLKLLTWMIAKGKLTIRIALREHADCYSLFHEKIGIFEDADFNWMTFTGSPNETMGGARRHAESFPLHRSWANAEQLAYAQEERSRFDSIWGELVDGIALWNANEWLEDPMRAQFGSREPRDEQFVPKGPGRRRIPPIEEASPPVLIPVPGKSLIPSLPDELELRDYQRDAVNDWLRRGGHGVYAMATGTGKTITALAAATQAARHAAQLKRPLLVLVVVPLIDLVEQWRKDATWFGFRPAVCHGKLNVEELRQLKSAFSAARSQHGERAEMVITTAGSLTPRSSMETPEQDHFLQRQLARHTGLILVIGDEMHSLGTQPRLNALPRTPTYTLGLSATPKRHGDEVGTEALLDYFGDPVVSISIKDAIYKYKALVPYDYHPSLVELTDEESLRYRAISQRIAAAYARGDEDAADVQIRARTRLTQHATNKLVRLRELMARGLSNQSHQIIYVAEGRDPETDIRQLDEVERILREEFGMRVERYFGETKGARREVLQRRLASGQVQALLAMKCLDEGVDIPSARIGLITSSSQNPRQFVQRRGRILRQDPVNPKSHAIIHDFIVQPPRAGQTALADSEKTLIGNELARAAELADAARNREVLFDIIAWAYDYGLDKDTYTWMVLSDPDGDEMEMWHQ